MFEIIEKTFSICRGLERRAEELLDSLAKEGEKKASNLPTREEIENKLVEGGTRAVSVAVNLLKKDREKIEKRIGEVLQGLLERLQVVTRGDIDVLEKVVSRAREKVDLLEKKMEGLEKERTK